MGKVSFQAWARNQAMASATTMLFGGVISILYRIEITSLDLTKINASTGIGAYACIFALIILAVERPLPGVDKMGAMITNFWVRTVLYALIMVPLLSQAPLIAAGFFLFVTSCFYAKAAHSGEVWVNQMDPRAGEEGGAPRGGGEKKKEEKKEEKKEKPVINPATHEYVSQVHLQPQYPGGYENEAQPQYAGGYGQGYDQQGYDQQGYDQQGYDQQGYGYDQQGYTS